MKNKNFCKFAYFTPKTLRIVRILLLSLQLDMSNYNIYIKLPRHLHQWLTFTLGNPVVFPAYSNENAVIRSFLSKRPEGVDPEVAAPGLTAIAIPDSVAKPPEVYNHIGERGKAAVTEAIKDLFIRALWADMKPVTGSTVRVNTLLSAWCESHGIDLDCIENVRQSFYRLRKQYDKKGINLKNIS